jgi:hypothetical protein
VTVLKPGYRLKSQVDDTQFVVVKAPPADVDVRVGGHPAVDINEEPDGSLSLESGEGTLIGKRYGRGAGDLEFLITQPGQGDVTVDSEVLVAKQSKSLPSSD